MLADRDWIGQLQTAFLQRFEDHIRGHQLGEAGRFFAVVSVLIKSIDTGVVVHSRTVELGTVKRISDTSFQLSTGGYTLSLNDSGALAISIAINPDANYTLSDFTPITAIATLPTVLVIKPAVPANTLAEFVALAKAKPGTMSFGSAGPGSIRLSPPSRYGERR